MTHITVTASSVSSRGLVLTDTVHGGAQVLFL
jgi:hypothetical protein